MPKRILGLTLAIAAFALAACSNGAISLSPATPTPVPGTPQPNPSITTAKVTVYASASPLPNQAVAVSTPDATGHAGAAFVTQLTDTTGVTTFSGLTGAATYCFSTTYNPPATPPSPPPLAQTQAVCTNLWSYNLIFRF